MEKFNELFNRFRTLFRKSEAICVDSEVYGKYGVTKSKLPEVIDNVAGSLMEKARSGYGEQIELKNGYVTLNDCVGKLNWGLTLAGENPKRYLPTVWKGSLEEDLLVHSYFAISCINPMYRKRAEVGYILDSYKFEYGNAGYSKRLNKTIPYYFTFFDKYLFCVDAINGIVYRSTEHYQDCWEFNVKNNKLFYGYREVAEECNGKLHLIANFEQKMHDNKQAEREDLIAQGFDIKNTCWLTTHLGYLGGSNTYIRSHTFILLMVYGFTGGVCYSLMERNSIMTCDHITPNSYSDNRIDNLALVTRTANNQKKDTNLKIFDYGMYFMGLEQPEEKVKVVNRQLSKEEMRKETEEALAELELLHKNMTAEDYAAKYGFIIVG